ncbi:MAG: hypothetical protein LUI07_01585, partial [Lachnospiraceae bacterium]|nr:hypothetical protein [Lachnospiraceae bacterium]
METDDIGVRTLTWTVRADDETIDDRNTDNQNASQISAQAPLPGSLLRGNKRKTACHALPTLETFLCAKGCSHHVLTHLKRTDHGILLNGEWAYTNQPVREGDVVTVRVVETEASERILPVQLPLRIVYEDADILVVDKPSDMPIHPSAGNYENTLANAVMYYFASKNRPFVFRCITRLDRDTT